MGTARITQQRRRREGLCVVCAIPARGTYCESHRQERNLYQRERKRKVLGCKRRNLNAESYSFTFDKGSVNGTSKN